MQSKQSRGDSLGPVFGRGCLDDTVSIVTGASSGFGARFVEVLAAHGSTVVAAARRLDRLERLAESHDSIHAFQCDVQHDEQLQALVDWTAESFGSVSSRSSMARSCCSLPALVPISPVKPWPWTAVGQLGDAAGYEAGQLAVTMPPRFPTSMLPNR